MTKMDVLQMKKLGNSKLDSRLPNEIYSYHSDFLPVTLDCRPDISQDEERKGEDAANGEFSVRRFRTLLDQMERARPKSRTLSTERNTILHTNSRSMRWCPFEYELIPTNR